MLSIKDNETLTQVSKGTPMGELMRRYWHPIAAAGELVARPTKRVRILGEDLVLYKDRSGTMGLIDALCPHRRVDLSYGIPEEHGLRCMYHGWMYNETGQCIEQPFEETVHPDGRFKEKVKIAGYPVQELSGLIFAYMGPLPAPALPHWEHLIDDNVVADLAISELPCNWLQCQENSVDAVHSEWLHGIYTKYLSTGEATRPRGQGTTIKIGFDVFANGIIKRRLQQGFPEDGEDWTVGHPILFPNILYVGSEYRTTTQWRVPVDDENTLHFSLYIFKPAPGVKAPEQPVVAWRHVPLTDSEGYFNVRHTFNQDYMAWITQGPIAARDLEKLGESDRGIISFRNQLKHQLAIIADGGEPMNTFWSEEDSSAIHLPMEQIKHGVLPDGKYRAGEAGESTDTDLIEEVMASWTGAYAGKQGAEGFAFL